MKDILEKIVKNNNGQVYGKYINCREKLTFQCAEGHIWKAQPRNVKEGSWCPVCAIERNRIYNIDHEFFSRDTPEAFYWAGFIAADGWVRSNSKLGYVLGISLSTKDLKHLERFKANINAEQLIKVFVKAGGKINGRKLPEREMCSIIISSKQIVKDLERFGIIQAKTYHLNIPDWLKQHSLAHHFLRGYIDGDGCFAIAKNKKQNPHITFCMRGTSEFLASFNEIMKNHNVIERDRKESSPLVGKKYAAFDKIQYSGNNIISKMYNYLYKDATVYLERKEEIAKKSVEWMVYNGGKKKKKIKENAIKITPEELIELAKEHRSQAKIAELLGCSSANISLMTKKFSIRDEFRKVIKGYNIVDKRVDYGIYTRTKEGMV